MRIAPNEYSIDDADAIKIIYGHGTNFIKVKSIPMSITMPVAHSILSRHHGTMPAAA